MISCPSWPWHITGTLNGTLKETAYAITQKTNAYIFCCDVVIVYSSDLMVFHYTIMQSYTITGAHGNVLVYKGIYLLCFLFIFLHMQC